MQYKVLNKINKENDIKSLEPVELIRLSREIRHYILECVNKNGGHLASNLGTVELTMACHMVMDFPKDKLIFDVGHQSYTHKILTGRKEAMKNMGDIDSISGFPRTDESPCDALDVGHASTSISSAVGMATARELLNTDETIIAVVGDGALTGGLAYEALNNLSSLKGNLIIIINDNNMSISPNVGGMSAMLNKIRINENYRSIKKDVKSSIKSLPIIGESLHQSISTIKKGIKQLVLPSMFFENLGLTYIGPVDGHDFNQLYKVLSEAKKHNKPVVVHTITQKGQGFKDAMEHPDKYHSVAPSESNSSEKPLTYSQCFGNKLVDLAEDNTKIVAITAAMEEGVGLKDFKNKFRERFFDVGIAEEHAISFASGLARMGLHPVVAIYSTFLQRAYDQLIHDVGLPCLPMTIMIDRAGLLTRDGRTHQGIYDLSYLSTVPNLIVAAPRNANILERLLELSMTAHKPMAIRYPKGKADTFLDQFQDKTIDIGKGQLITNEAESNSNKSILIIAIGNMVEQAKKLKAKLELRSYGVTIYDPIFIKPMPIGEIYNLSQNKELVITLEENIATGGFGQQCFSKLAELYEKADKPMPKLHEFALDDSKEFDKGDIEYLREKGGISIEKIVDVIEALS